MYLNYISRDFQYCYIRIRNNFYSSAKYFDSDSIHDLRVEIKRLRAFFRLIEAINPKFKYKKNFKQARALFKAAENLRDVQVQQALTREWESKLDVQLEDYANLLRQNEIAAKLKLSKFLKNYSLKPLKQKGKPIQQVLSRLQEETAQENANAHLNILLNQLKLTHEEAEQNPEKLHNLRTQAKQIRYTFDLLLQCLPNVDYPRATSTRLKHLHHVLGLWHDNVVALELLNKFRDDYSNQFQPDSDLFSRLEQAIHKEQKLHLRKFHQAWSSLFSLLEQQ